MQHQESPWRTEFVQRISRLAGDLFRDAVIFSLRRSIISFQTVPDTTCEACGIDGLSHNETRAYSCFGFESDPSDTPKRVHEKICNGFRAKLRRTFELTLSESRRPKLIQSQNSTLASLMADGKKISTISLIVNAYDDSTLLASLHNYFNQCMSASLCRYISEECALIILGPQELAMEASVDEQTLFHIENPLFRALFDEAETEVPATITDDGIEDFQAKFDHLIPLGTSPVQITRVNSLRKAYHRAWMKSIIRDTHIANSFPEIHRKIERIRSVVVTDAYRESMRLVENAADLISRVELTVADRIEREFGEQLPDYIRRDLGEGELARLIGTCPLDWRP